MKTTKPKKRPHRTHNRTPKLYRWADIATEALIYFTILWGPWAFGTVHDWAILTMNLANYGIGALLLTKWAVRYKTGYYPPRWTTQKNGQSTPQPPKRDWRTKAVAALTLYMLGYILISIFNVRATFNHEFNFFEYQENYIKWLPHTYDKSATIQSFLNFLGLACCFWGIRDWLLGKTRKERMESDQPAEEDWLSDKEHSTPSIPIRLNRFLWLLCISGGLLALIGIIQRLDGTPKLLWIYERERFGISTQSFGPFGYRSNGASYLNMIIPISIGFLMAAIQNHRSRYMQQGRKTSEAYYTLIPLISLMWVALVVSLSRGGILVISCNILCGVTIIALNPRLLTSRQRLGLVLFTVISVGISYFIGWKPLINRYKSQNSWYETKIEKPNFSDTITFHCSLPSPPFVNDHRLFHITDSQNGTFQKSHIDALLQKSGNLQIMLYDTIRNSSIRAYFTNLTETLDSGILELELTRNQRGLAGHANQTPLIGIETTTGNNPPTWVHPIVPNEILLQKKSSINPGVEYLECSLFNIRPHFAEWETSTQNTEFFELDFNDKFSFAQMLSRHSSRDRIYEDSWRMAKDYRWLGCGTGAWTSVYFLYHDADEAWDAWVHCDWLEYWITFGLFGTIPSLVLTGLTLLPLKSQTGLITAGWLRIGLNLAIAGCLLHALFDFPLQVISIMHLFVILCAVKMVTGRKV